ncbi:bifunctional adenosylcobinamide kinase/adenosylcobinamide-phosphate guanylyltransferase [Paenibacillus sp. SC116]|uniref:bifunctional adenosylcobinamide kinase/adenosylcobinamide-phosphate guanylyltransferase n=1 Tax=Paenibacillus sp. SC116 TaxID=2968986 RepID=UPI00215AB1AF|nr:bifunctional adenosylcobinamide kinase/adenosylcobinamide-phosphate guanylyltransferase [Paenibacillus sp. SC116]MCR8843972.1 bifunctional adenosylcobinamide kinase/adenosylcobinamide-phosphate guanylyltransferase [Paenibacillus sp. SC116]
MSNHRIILVTGGARSGKSTFAEKYMMKLAPEGSSYYATAQPFDQEMKDRIIRHQQDREKSGFAWKGKECPLELPEQLQQETSHYVLVDCLTIWLSNELLAVEQQPDAEQLLADRIDQLEEAVKSFGSRGTVILVTNEVGSGVVPAYELGRTFRDHAGRLNQRMAALADEVYLVTAGIPIELKSRMVQL